MTNALIEKIKIYEKLAVFASNQAIDHSKIEHAISSIEELLGFSFQKALTYANELYDSVSSLWQNKEENQIAKEKTIVHQKALDEIDKEGKFLIGNLHSLPNNINNTIININRFIHTLDQNNNNTFLEGFRTSLTTTKQALVDLASNLKHTIKSDGSKPNHENAKYEETKQELLSSEHESPLHSAWVNLGGFSPGVYLNETHKNGHYGQDMQAPSGTAVYAFAPGKVLSAGQSPGNTAGGITVTILHYNKTMTYYAHLSSVNVTAGDKVETSTQIGSVGNSGNAMHTSPHLHFEIHHVNDNTNPTANWDGSAVNPADFIPVPPYMKSQLPDNVDVNRPAV